MHDFNVLQSEVRGNSGKQHEEIVKTIRVYNTSNENLKPSTNTDYKRQLRTAAGDAG